MLITNKITAQMIGTANRPSPMAYTVKDCLLTT